MEKKNEDLKGYPHYPAKDDITKAWNNNGRETPATPGAGPDTNDTFDEKDPEIKMTPGTDADLNADDLLILEATGQNMNTQDARNLISSSLENTDNDGDPLNEDSSILNDFSASDLDIPIHGSEPGNNPLNNADEENDFYSLGGDLHDDLEESKGE